MAYDVDAMTLHLRTMIRDPNGDMLTSAEVRTDYLDVAYKDWWRRYEHRSAAGAISVTLNPGVRSIPIPGLTRYNPELYSVQVTDPVSGVEFGVRRSEYNRIRWLQETEGATGIPRQWGWANFSLAVTGPEMALYPLADQAYTITSNFGLNPSTLTSGTSIVSITPVNARYVTRIAAYRAGIDLKLTPRILNAIIAPLPPWVKINFNMRYNAEFKATDRENALGYERVKADR